MGGVGGGWGGEQIGDWLVQRIQGWGRKERENISQEKDQKGINGLCALGVGVEKISSFRKWTGFPELLPLQNKRVRALLRQQFKTNVCI